MSHLVSENKSVYFLIRFAQMKITLLIFVNKWVIRENESLLQVEPCARLPKSRGDGEYHVIFFLRLTTIIVDYLRYTRPLPYLSSILCVALKVYLTHHCMRQVRLHLIVSCVARSFSNKDSLLSEL